MYFILHQGFCHDSKLSYLSCASYLFGSTVFADSLVYTYLNLMKKQTHLGWPECEYIYTRYLAD